MIEKLEFGKTGHQSTRVIFGAAAFSAMKQERADRVLDLLLENGINHFDTAARYGDSELRLAPWLKQHRKEVFLATKTGERTYAGARDEIRQSLERLGVDQIDLIQLHHLVDEEQHARALGPGGALEAAIEARDAGFVRFIGVTGHGTRAAAMHLRSLEHFEFDSVLTPYNFTSMADPEYAADFEALLRTCHERGVAVQTIKGVARRRWRDDTQRKFSWYEPIKNPEALERAVRWVLGRPGIFLNTTSDATLLPDILRTAQTAPTTPDADAMQRDVASHAIEPLFVRGVSEEV